jgi:hypothetical protein
MQIKKIMIENKSYKNLLQEQFRENACKNIGVASRTKLRFSFAKSIFFRFTFSSGVFEIQGNELMVEKKIKAHKLYPATVLIFDNL